MEGTYVGNFHAVQDDSSERARAVKTLPHHLTPSVPPPPPPLLCFALHRPLDKARTQLLWAPSCSSTSFVATTPRPSPTADPTPASGDANDLTVPPGDDGGPSKVRQAERDGETQAITGGRTEPGEYHDNDRVLEPGG